ncbi:MAG: TIR domain-containing protein [Acidobacteriaceae bacterium]
MRLLAEWKLEHKGSKRSIELYWGDLSWLPPEHAVDLLVVSAFPNDYIPTPTSLIGALDRNGVSVARLALEKEIDMREDFSCWISEPVLNSRSFSRILCVESGWRGTPPEVAEDLFRALAPSSLTRIAHRSIAMPLIGAGDQGYSADQMMKAILRAAVAWVRRGLDVEVLKIVAYSSEAATLAQKAFVEARRGDEMERPAAEGKSIAGPAKAAAIESGGYDLFISYAHEDAETALKICGEVQRAAPLARIFVDRKELATGTTWTLGLAESLDEAKIVAALFTPRYWSSKFCKLEFVAAFTRQNDTGRPVLFPIYFERATIPYLFQTVQFTDCRQSDAVKLKDACTSLSKVLR